MSGSRALERELKIGDREEQAARREAMRLTERLAGQTRELARTRRLEQTVSALSVALRQTSADIERALDSRAWRWGHRITRTLSRLARRPVRTEGALAAALARIERVQSATHIDLSSGSAADAARGGSLSHAAVETLSPVSQAPMSPEQVRELERRRGALAKELRRRLGPAPERERWPSVSVIIPTRDGRADLERLFAGPDRSHELRRARGDRGGQRLERWHARLSARICETPFPLHVVEAGEHLSFAHANARGVERAAGELLLFLNNDIEPFEEGWLKELVCVLGSDGVEAAGATLLHAEDLARAPGEPRVQHRAIRFRWQEGTVKAFNEGDGESLWEGPFGAELRAPAVTAACMLIKRESFARVGGFETTYRYGTEDVDLGLKLLQSGAESAGAGRSVLVHRESSSQNRASRDFRRLNREENRRLFLETWGPLLLREYRLARLRCEPFWTDGAGAHVAVTLTSLDVADGWGDWYSGHEIGDALEELGWRVSYVERKGERWYELPEDVDYLLSLMDSFDLSRLPAHVGAIAWIRNWTERWLERPWFERADLLLVSSARSAELIEERTGRRTVRFPLAVNPERFRPRPVEPRFAADYVFTGNRWGKDREIQEALEPRDGERVAVYGKGWEEVEEWAPYVRGELPYEELALLYPSAKLVLDDTQGPTLPYGAVNARVFDALAAGTLVITNCESGVRELFDDEFPVWSSRESLQGEARRAALGRAPARRTGGALPRGGARAPYLRPPCRAPARAPRRVRAATHVLPEDRRARPRRGAAMGRPALRRGDRARASPARTSRSRADAR